MNTRLVNSEPLPGYRLIERIGRGGYGEVWKAEAPGGILKAVKMVYGDLEESTSKEPAEQELKSLHRVKGIRHPYILSLERFDIVEGQLLIVMELADRNLWDRYVECREQNLRGIPRDELLRYMEEAAEALDLMNIQHQIQHLDIKPQNLFLVHNHIKVADFGLAKDFEGRRATMTGGVTPVYAAPETFEGWISRYSDQYSLAIVFQELLTGIRPYSGVSSRQLLLQHISGAPDVSSLPKSDQMIIRRAMSKNPEERFASCMELVKALQKMGEVTPIHGLEGSTPTPLPGEGSQITPSKPLSSGRAQEWSEAEQGIKPDQQSSKNRKPSSADLAKPPASGSGRSLITPIHQQAPLPSRNRSELSNRLKVPQTQFRSMMTDTYTSAKMCALAPERTGQGVLFPALIVGLGKIGISVVQRLKQLIAIHHDHSTKMPHLAWLLLDTDGQTLEGLQDTSRGESTFTADEIFNAPLQRPSHYLQKENELNLDRWLGNHLLYRIPRSPSSMGLRALGRLAFLDHARELSKRIRQKLELFADGSAIEEAEQATGLKLRNNRPQIYVVSSTCGGSGSGMLIDLVYLLRRQLREMGYSTSQVHGTLLLPYIDRQKKNSQAVANTFATLRELDYFSQPDRGYELPLQRQIGNYVDVGAPFRSCAVLHLPKNSEGKDMLQTIDLSAGRLYHELFTQIGPVSAEARLTYEQNNPRSGFNCQSFGLYRMCWPREQILFIASWRFSLRLVDRWRGKMEFALHQEEIDSWVDEQWLKSDFYLSAIRRQLDEKLRDYLEMDITSKINSMTNPISSLASSQTNTDMKIVIDVLGEIVRLFGKSGKDEDLHPGEIADFLVTSSKKIVQEKTELLREIAFHFVEKPGFRLSGSEEAVRQIQKKINEIERDLENNTQQANQASEEAYQQLLSAIALVNKCKSNKLGAAFQQLIEMIQIYSQNRVQQFILKELLGIYRCWSNLLPELLRDISHNRNQIGEARQRVVQYYQSIPTPNTFFDHPILPQGCNTLFEAIDQFIQTLSEEVICEWETEFQDEWWRLCRGFLHTFTHLNESMPRFLPLLQKKVRDFLDERLQNATPAEIFFLHRQDLQKASREIHRAFDESAPELVDPRSKRSAEVLVLATPFNPSGDQFRQLTRDLLADTDLIVASSDRDIVFYREIRSLGINDLPQVNSLAREIVDDWMKEHQLTPHAREDISW